MSEQVQGLNEAKTVPQQPTREAQLKDIEAIRDLFARAHDYIAQASHPGHMGMKIAEVLNFLAFQHNDFKLRGEKLSKQIEADKQNELSKVDVAAAQQAVDAVLVEKPSQVQVADENGAVDAPKA
jgi:hypothetical protein